MIILSNFVKKMSVIDLWNDNNVWRILINIVGTISILVAIFLIYISVRKVIQLISGNKVRVLKNIYAKVYELPSNSLKNEVQFGFELPIKTDLVFSVNDQNDQLLIELFKGELDKGVHVYRFDSTKLENGNYFLNYKSTIQNINRKVEIRN